jgi:uncharacterized protein YjiS (DUF1127 family)
VTEVNRIAKPCPPAHLCLKSDTVPEIAALRKATCSSASLIRNGPSLRIHIGRPAFSLSYWAALATGYRDRWRQRKALLELDDRMLADIGITKSQAIQEAKKPFWK